MQAHVSDWRGYVFTWFHGLPEQWLIDIAERNALLLEVMQRAFVAPTRMTDLDGQRILAKLPYQQFQVIAVFVNVLEGNWELHQHSTERAFFHEGVEPGLRFIFIFIRKSNRLRRSRFHHRHRR